MLEPDRPILPMNPEAVLGSEYRDAFQRLNTFNQVDVVTLTTLDALSTATRGLGRSFADIIQSQGHEYYSYPKGVPQTKRLIFVEFPDKHVISLDIDDKNGGIGLSKFDGPDNLGLQFGFPGFSLKFPLGREINATVDSSLVSAVEVRPQEEQAKAFVEFIEKDPLLKDTTEDMLLKEGFASKFNPVEQPNDPAVVQSYARLLKEMVSELVPLLPPPVEVPKAFDF